MIGSLDSVNLILAVLTVWLLVLSLAAFSLFRFLKRLTEGISQADLRKVLEKIWFAQDKQGEEIKNLDERLKILSEDGSFHIQKVGLVRFNPFKDIGGDHSFSIALLDSHDTGIILTGLHTRERTRVYIKDIKNGKSEHELSEEEKKAVAEAQRK